MRTRKETDLLVSIIKSQDIVERIALIESLVSLRFKRRHSFTLADRLFFKQWVKILRSWKEVLKALENAC